MSIAPNQVRAYELRIKGARWTRTVHATTAGKAKSEYWRDASEAFPDLRFIDIEVVGVSGPRTSDEFRRNAAYRNIPFAYVGMRVLVDGNEGVIVGHNSSANLDVLFGAGKYNGQTLNCHPHSGVQYFDKNGAEIPLESAA